ncbi:MAG TPA: hypothetical protein VF756_14715 [Thermoanaerobaculia bacterium]
MTELPVACSLSDPELKEREAGTLRRVRERIEEVRELEAGYALRFAAEDGALEDLFEVIRLERKCCPFLRFGLVVPPGGEPVWLELTGPEGTKEFLRDLGLVG